MQVFDILKRIDVLPEESLEHLEEFVSAEEKGYPSILHPLKIVADFDDETNKLRGYTSYRDFGKFFFVGNSFVFDKEGGVFRRLLEHRDNKIGEGIPKITLLNPLKSSALSIIFNSFYPFNISWHWFIYCRIFSLFCRIIF